MEDLSLKAAVAYRERGRQLAEEGNLEGALLELNKAIEQNAREAETYLILSEINQSLEKHKEAIDFCQKALTYEPDNVSAWLRMADIYDEMEDYDNALQVLNYALQYGDKNPDIFYLMGYINAEKENFKSACEFMKKALQLNPEHEEAKRDLEAIREALK
jgi:tetratricopeptide (TPR) repeat protein